MFNTAASLHGGRHESRPGRPNYLSGRGHPGRPYRLGRYPDAALAALAAAAAATLASNLAALAVPAAVVARGALGDDALTLNLRPRRLRAARCS